MLDSRFEDEDAEAVDYNAGDLLDDDSGDGATAISPCSQKAKQRINRSVDAVAPSRLTA